jgi:peptide deformylase
MAILPLVIAPDEFLKQKSTPVAVVDDEVRALLDDMLDTMYRLRGIGLAAVQVGILKRLIVVDVSWREDDSHTRKPLKLINAEIVSDSDEESSFNEGCLSFPDQYSEVVRPSQVKIRYLDEQGKQHELEADGILATCIQHEIDHTNGITFVDHISRLKRDMIHKKLIKAKKAGVFDHDHHHHHDYDHVHGEHCNH